jgi:hypothetical protein
VAVLLAAGDVDVAGQVVQAGALELDPQGPGQSRADAGSAAAPASDDPPAQPIAFARISAADANSNVFNARRLAKLFSHLQVEESGPFRAQSPVNLPSRTAVFVVCRETCRKDVAPDFVNEIRGVRQARASRDAAARRHMWSIITCPNPEHETCVAPSISRAKS